jgi:hypothetical protein
MVIRRQSEATVPVALPGAQLYLDDIEELSRIVLEVAEKSALLLGDSDPVLKYKTRDFVCDTVADLKELGGEAPSIEIFATEYCQLTIERDSAFWAGGGLDDDERWKYYARIREVFDRRSSMWRKISNIPAIELPIVGLGFGIGVGAYYFLRSAAVSSPNVAIVLISYAAAIIVLVVKLLTRPAVKFRYERESGGLRKEWQTLRPYAIGAIIGGLATKLGEAIAEALLKLR